METLAYSPLVSHILKYTSTTVGRDKIYRAVQYWSRFYAWYLLRKGKTPDVIAPWAALKSHLALSRKLMRVGKNVEHLKAASLLIQEAGKTDPILRALGIGRQLGYAGYLTYDVANWAHGSKFVTLKNNKEISKIAARFWFTGLSCNIAAGLYKIYVNRQQQQAIASRAHTDEKNVQTKKLEKDLWAAQKQLLQDCLDICNPGTSIGLFNFDDGFIGLAGLGSSFLGIASQWKKTAPA
ncbi:hypothetical protein PYCC9005_004672 [Savitreella phatthalungensis]